MILVAVMGVMVMAFLFSPLFALHYPLQPVEGRRLGLGLVRDCHITLLAHVLLDQPQGVRPAARERSAC